MQNATAMNYEMIQNFLWYSETIIRYAVTGVVCVLCMVHVILLES